VSPSQLIASRFKIVDPEKELLGRGGMGEVYRARFGTINIVEPSPGTIHAQSRRAGIR
jgi:hypothetical protein